MIIKNKNKKNKKTSKWVTKIGRLGADPTLFCTLMYNSEDTSASAGSFNADSFNANNTFDPKDSFLTETFGYIKEYYKFYDYNIVHSINYKATISNLDSSPLTIGFVPSIGTALVPLSNADVRDYLEHAFAQKVILDKTGTGNSQKVLSWTLNLPRYYGKPIAYHGSELFSCSSTSGPYTTIYANLLSSTNGAVKYDIQITVTAKIEFYSMTNTRDSMSGLADRLPSDVRIRQQKDPDNH